MRVDSRASLDICANCCGVSKLTTFLTSAITDSNLTAGYQAIERATQGHPHPSSGRGRRCSSQVAGLCLLGAGQRFGTGSERFICCQACATRHRPLRRFTRLGQQAESSSTALPLATANFLRPSGCTRPFQLAGLLGRSLATLIGDVRSSLETFCRAAHRQSPHHGLERAEGLQLLDARLLVARIRPSIDQASSAAPGHRAPPSQGCRQRGADADLNGMRCVR